MNTYNLFKYRAINKNFLDSLIKGYIYFSEPENLNDPFDCQVDINDSLDRAIEACGGEAKNNLQKLKKGMPDFFSEIQKDFKKYGVCSFSQFLLKPVLWSHYSDGHRGVCLMYKFPVELITSDQNQIIGIKEVAYGNKLLTKWFVKKSEKLPDMPFPTFAERLIQEVLTIKGKDWKYEKEMRILKVCAGPQEIDKSFLAQVCFGLNTTESDRDLVRKVVNDSGYNVSFCEIVRSDSDFKLSVNDL